MGVSIYYKARRPHRLDADEQSAIDRLVAAFSLDNLKADDGRDRDWEGFWVYDPADPTEPDVVFEGATTLPDDSAEEMWEAVTHWAALLSQIRRAVPGAQWHVHVDDHDLEWDEKAQEYDPSN